MNYFFFRVLFWKCKQEKAPNLILGLKLEILVPLIRYGGGLFMFSMVAFTGFV